jgi:uncharacterized protein
MNRRLSQLYTPLDEATAVLRARRNACTLSTGTILERHLSVQPYAVLFRHVASPNFEFERFLPLASSAGLAPLVLEFHSDRFLTRNPLKCALARLRFSGGPNGACNTPISTLRVTDLALSDGVAFRDVTTLWHQPLIEFHHELLFSRPEFRRVELFDCSEWISVHGPKAHDYYPHLFSLFVDHAILFDDFLLTPSEQQFTSEVVVPAFELASSLTGRKPLICHIDSTDTAESPSWFHYAHDYAQMVQGRLSSVGHSSVGKASVQPDAVAVRACDLGYGVFALHRFSSGQRILRFSGRLLNFDEAHADPLSSFNMLQVGPRAYLDLAPPAVFINHSCDPNAGFADGLCLVALREIAPGEEIRYDFSTTMDDNTSTMACACGSARCRKCVNDFGTLPIELQQDYLSRGIVLPFIRRSIMKNRLRSRCSPGQVPSGV